jgi:amino acid adenylation domain-containing protein
MKPATESAARCPDLVERIDQHAVARPRSVAIQFGTEQITYAELAGWSSALAADLRDRGVGPGDIVAVAVERGLECVVGFVAVLRAGAAYLVADPGIGRANQQFLYDDARCRAVLTPDPAETGRETVALRDGCSTTWRADSDPLDPAYVCYTSGTTGRRKGVVVSRSSLSVFVDGSIEQWSVTSEDVIGSVTPYAWDGSMIDLWLPLSVGARMVGLGDDLRTNPVAIAAFLRDNDVNLMMMPTALGQLVLRSPELSNATGLRHLVVGGDRLTVRPSPDATYTVWNIYGPTEATVFATAAPVDAHGTGDPHIGYPVAGAAVEIVDDLLGPVRPGEIGEIVIGGSRVAQGYLYRPAATAAAFVPGSHGSRRYRTGDFARWRADGAAEFIGRRDRQVSLHGRRIELDGITARVRAIQEVNDAWVDVADAGQPGARLVAFVVPAGPEVGDEMVRRELEARLSPGECPRQLVLLDEIPLSAGGKPARTVLLRLAADLLAASIPPQQDDQGPRDELEECVAGEWSAQLERGQVGMTDDFFASGGNSLQAIKLLQALQEAFEIELSAVAFFADPTPAGLSELIRAAIVAEPFDERPRAEAM